ncbi:imidazoleglycerol-phosphate dehydratase HisB [Oceanicaulis sp. MMSF_3324]|uniref:imidazoleglycerol-phosphate dehydratase HisB n=1 Tax=Oceanicaulis sp. MMSF_3324 TaxID=3046702 RepID=UPI00273F1CED|nr:imidazoleglycerol-phosphate dehydratase HisB [Oceanicaulis sp. MMSF_3324]
MSGVFDLSKRPEDMRAMGEQLLLERLETLLETPKEYLALASSTDEARQAVWSSELTLTHDFGADGVIALDEPAQQGLTLYRIGGQQTPITVLSAMDANQAALLQSKLNAVPCCLLEEGLTQLSPGARLAARKDREERDAILQDIAQLLSEELGEVAQVTSRGLVYEHTNPMTLGRLGLVLAEDGEGLVGHVRDAQTARELSDFLGFSAQRRIATVRRVTKETEITLSLDLDREGADIDTGNAFFDHMLEQIARHGGIALSVSCQGDLEVDAHHTIEDVCLALGEGLRQALGDKRGIARFGFELPMDETRAGVWIDLSGRPYAVFEGEIPGDRVGDFPVEMCPHAFRSIAESLKAALHVKVEGDNAHHMIESTFKAFGRALRMAVRVEGDALPSTKGVL